MSHFLFLFKLLCKAYEICSKPNKTQREQLVAETGLSLRVIQVNI